ncbi:MAG: catalase [Janthinobacterium lividum]
MSENGQTNGNGNGANSADGVGQASGQLTTRQGHPVYDNQNLRTVGARGPAVLENYHFLEKITHFDRERIPERVVHARGAAAHGFFEPTGKVGDEPIAKYTRAKLFQTAGKQTPIFTRFSTVVHGGHSPETLRDPRGFAIKFYTEDGNWDLVGNNLKVFFIRDATKFPDMVHAFKPDPLTNQQSDARFQDFLACTPESTNMFTFLFSPWGIPAAYRFMQGSGVNTYKWVNAEGVAHLVKYHFEPKQGIKNLMQEEANAIQATNFNHATQDLHDAIERGEFPEWDMFVQLLSDDEHPELDFDPLDATKLWPKEQFPFLHVGSITLNKNPDNYFAETEQVAFGTGVLVDGLEFSDDKLLVGRTFSYSDTQRYRVGTNYLQLPINAPKTKFATNQRDGQMTFRVDTVAGQNPSVNYEPSLMNGIKEASPAPVPYTPLYEGRLVRQKIDRENNFKQAGDTWRNEFDESYRAELINNLSGALSNAIPAVQEKIVSYCTQADAEYGRRLKEALDKKLGMHGKGTQTEAVEEAQEMAVAGNAY